jgi:F-type H+-transporting ATPase subunit epsilon
VTLHVELVSPEKKVWSGDARMVICRIVGSGDIAFLTGHAPFLGALDIHPIVMYLDDGTEEVVACRGGFIEVSHDHVKVLSDQSELPHHIDPDEARAALASVEALLQRSDEGDPHVVDEARWQTTRLKAVGHEV